VQIAGLKYLISPYVTALPALAMFAGTCCVRFCFSFETFLVHVKKQQNLQFKCVLASTYH
jgi:hypothetical protein